MVRAECRVHSRTAGLAYRRISLARDVRQTQLLVQQLVHDPAEEGERGHELDAVRDALEGVPVRHQHFLLPLLFHFPLPLHLLLGELRRRRPLVEAVEQLEASEARERDEADAQGDALQGGLEPRVPSELAVADDLDDGLVVDPSGHRGGSGRKWPLVDGALVHQGNVVRHAVSPYEGFDVHDLQGLVAPYISPKRLKYQAASKTA